VTRYLVYRFVLSAALVPVAVSHDPAENKRVIMPGTGDMAAARTAGSPAHSARHSRQAHRQISSKARAPFAQI
jgi:D-aminopeptidase